MPYSVMATSKTPSLIIYLIDSSTSMNTLLDGERRIDRVSSAFSGVQDEMVDRCRKDLTTEELSDKYLIGLFGYSDFPFNVYSQTDHMKVVTISEADKRGKPRFPVVASTDTYEAFLVAKRLLEIELPKRQNAPAPIVCHLTDGMYTGPDPEPIAAEIMKMGNDDGNVLIENVYFNDSMLNQPLLDPTSWQGVFSESELSNDYAKKLFRMSSTLPTSIAQVVREEGYSLREGCKMLIPWTSQRAGQRLLELAFTMSTLSGVGMAVRAPHRLNG